MEYEGDQGSGPEVGQDAPGGQEAPAAPPTPPPWLDQVEQNFSNQIAALGQQLEERLPPAGHDPETGWDSEDDRTHLGPDADPLADWAEGLFGDEEDLADGPRTGFRTEAEREADRRRELAGEVGRHVEERLAPILEEQRTEQFQALQEEYPELATPEGAEALAGLVHTAARYFGHPELVENPRFAKVLYLAKKGEERANAEQPAGGGREVALEDGGGTPGEPEPDHLFQQLWAQGQKSKLQWD